MPRLSRSVLNDLNAIGLGSVAIEQDYFYLRGGSSGDEQYESCPVEAPCAAPIDTEVGDLAAGVREYFDAVGTVDLDELPVDGGLDLRAPDVRARVPEPVQLSHDYYYENVEVEDWDSIWLTQRRIARQDLVSRASDHRRR